MQINVMPEIGDDVVLMLHQAHEIGAVVKANNSTPCSLCRASMELNDGIIHRDHFHVSDTGACARKTFYLMRDGYKKSATKAQFLNDGHLHEASMISNLMAGLPDGWKIKPMENKSEMRLDILGFTLIGHIDALLYEPSYAANGQGRAYIV